MRDRKLLAFYGLKYNPFLPGVPSDDLWALPGSDSFLFRVETLVMDGGFALISGDPGLGKSKLLNLVANRLRSVGGVTVGVAEHPTAMIGDLYRELGTLFGVNLRPANRYGSFTALRARWRDHLRENLFRPVLLVDEAQDMPTPALNELRILGSERFDSEQLLTIVLCGDTRLTERFRAADLLPLGTRIRTRITLQPLAKDDLAALLEHLVERAGAPALLTAGLRTVLVDHAAGNARVLCTMAAELLDVALQRNKPVVDESLFLELYDRTPKKQKVRL